jgi:hypothetical protein
MKAGLNFPTTLLVFIELTFTHPSTSNVLFPTVVIPIYIGRSFIVSGYSINSACIFSFKMLNASSVASLEVTHRKTRTKSANMLVQQHSRWDARVPAPHNHSHHYQCRTPYAAVHTLVLLMMGIMMPETC